MQRVEHQLKIVLIRQRRAIRTLAGVLIAAGGVCLAIAASATAATLGATATVATPGSLTPLSSGGSATVFTVTLPANAACTGDTASRGYHVYSYLVPKGTNVSTITFVNSPSTGYGFVDNTGLYYGAANTAIGTGQIVSIPNDFEWAPLVVNDHVSLSTLLYTAGTSGVWEGGIACADTNGKLSDNWGTEITFKAAAGDPNGFTWSAVPGGGTTSTTTTTTSTTSTTTTGGSTGGTTTTQGSDSTTTVAGSTTGTTTAVAGAVAASSDSPSSSGGTGTGSGTSSAAGPLPFTGLPLWKVMGAGLLGIGIGLMLLGWGTRGRRRVGRPLPPSPW